MFFSFHHMININAYINTQDTSTTVVRGIKQLTKYGINNWCKCISFNTPLVFLIFTSIFIIITNANCIVVSHVCSCTHDIADRMFVVSGRCTVASIIVCNRQRTFIVWFSSVETLFIGPEEAAVAIENDGVNAYYRLVKILVCEARTPRGSLQG